MQWTETNVGSEFRFWKPLTALWNFNKVAYDALVGGTGEYFESEEGIDIIKARYKNDETDEFLKPIVFSDESRVKGL